jgi:hypothetical protein
MFKVISDKFNVAVNFTRVNGSLSGIIINLEPIFPEICDMLASYQCICFQAYYIIALRTRYRSVLQELIYFIYLFISEL